MTVLDFLNILMDDELLGLCVDGGTKLYSRDGVPYKYLNQKIDGIASSTNANYSIIIYVK
jgi:hypothetical protein